MRNAKLNARSLMLFVAALLLASGWWFFTRPAEVPNVEGNTVDEEWVAQGLELPAEEPTPFDEVDWMDAIAAIPTPAEKRAAASASETPDSQSDTEALTPEQIINRQDLEAQIEAAFSGDNTEAIELSQLLNQCRYVPESKQRIEQSIERAAESFAAGKPLKQFRASRTVQEFDSIEAFETERWDTYYRCDAARALINEDFWERLERAADGGDPVARYLFATLPHNSNNTFLGFDQWDDVLELSEQSREYTWRNMQEREPLGLLAMAQTSRFSNQFGSGGASVNVVMSLAAVKCGLATPELLDQVDQMLENLKRMELTHPGALDQLNIASDEAKRMFCK